MSSSEDKDGAKAHKPPDPPDLGLGWSDAQNPAGSDQQQVPDPSQLATTTVCQSTTVTTTVSQPTSTNTTTVSQPTSTATTTVSYLTTATSMLN